MVAACPQRVIIGNCQWNASRRPNATTTCSPFGPARVNRCAAAETDASVSSLVSALAGGRAPATVDQTRAECNVAKLYRAGPNLFSPPVIPIDNVQSSCMCVETDAIVCDSDLTACESRGSIELARLKFVDIKVSGLTDRIISALSDSGSEVNVAKTSIVSQLDLTPLGVVQLRGILGSPISATLWSACTYN